MSGRGERLAGELRDWWHAGVRLGASLWDRTAPAALLGSGSDAACSALPLVLLPGVWERWRFLMPLARRLAASGHPVHPVPALGWNGADLERSAARVAALLTDADITGAVIVAHSKGGLIGKRAMLLPGASGRILGMVAVSTPFQGSSLASCLPARTTLGLFSPTGPAITALSAERAVNGRIVSIAPRWDQVVPDGSALPGARNITLDAAGHFRPVASAELATLVHAEAHALADRYREDAP